jgi:hypothetical protein
VKDAYDPKLAKKMEDYKTLNPKKAITEAIRKDLMREIVLEENGMLEGADNFNPEVDRDDEKQIKEIKTDMAKEIKEEIFKAAEQKEANQRVEEAVRRSQRLVDKAAEKKAVELVEQGGEEEEEEEEGGGGGGGRPKKKPAKAPARPPAAAAKAAPVEGRQRYGFRARK